MMRLWAESYAKSTPAVTSATLSIVAHAVLIVGWVVSTLPAADVPADSIANRVIFMPPPDRVGGGSGEQGQRETIHYINLTQPGPGFGDGPRTIGDAPVVAPDQTLGRTAADSVTAPAIAPTPPPQDSVFSVLDVDTAVVRTANSAAPAYPLKLLQAHVMGTVAAQYVVDTTGFADTTSFHIMKSTNAEFEKAVREALPYMRFTPAKIGSIKVRQLVEQQFTFRITEDTTARTPPRKRKP